MKTQLPSVKAEQREKEKLETEQARKKAAERLTSAMRETFASPSGQIVLKWLHDECNFAKPILGAVAGQIDRDVTLYQAMRLNIYLKIRAMLTFETLKEIEYDN